MIANAKKQNYSIVLDLYDKRSPLKFGLPISQHFLDFEVLGDYMSFNTKLMCGIDISDRDNTHYGRRMPKVNMKTKGSAYLSIFLLEVK